MDLSPENKKPDYPVVPGYKITGLLGRGGMGKVFRAADLRLGREVAIKTIMDATDEELVSRFESEARAIARLDHPNIARMYDFTRTDDGVPACVMELVPGGSLLDLVQKKPVSFREAAMMVETIARAIEFSHKSGIVHRDLKPGNILLSRVLSEADSPAPDDATMRSPPGSTPRGSRTGTADSCLQPSDLKVVDFGLAKSIKGDSRITRTGQILGTPAYMSPEQASGVVSKIGPHADIYSLGAVLYELIAGKPPFLANDPMQTMMMLLSEEPVAPRLLNRAVPPDLQTICLKCLEKKPARRFETAEALADDLSRWLNDLPIISRPTSWYLRGWKWTRRNPWKAVAAGLVIALAVGGTAASLLLAAANRQTRSANTKLESRNEDLDRANRQANAAFETAHSTLDKIVRNVRDELYQIPQAEALTESTVTMTADMYRRLLELRPGDPDVMMGTISSLKIVWLNDWLNGRRENSRQQVEELTDLLDRANTEWPEDPWFAIERTALESERLELIDAASQPDQFRNTVDEVELSFQKLLERFPVNPDAIRAAGAWQARRSSLAINQQDLEAAREALRKRIELAEKFSQVENPRTEYSALWLAQALCVKVEFELALKSEVEVESWLARAREVVGSLTGGLAENRDVRQRLAEIFRLEAIVAFRQGDVSLAMSRFSEAASTMKRLVEEFPGDHGYRLDRASILFEQSRLHIVRKEIELALELLAGASEQVQSVLDDDPDNGNALNLKSSIEQAVSDLRDGNKQEK